MSRSGARLRLTLPAHHLTALRRTCLFIRLFVMLTAYSFPGPQFRKHPKNGEVVGLFGVFDGARHRCGVCSSTRSVLFSWWRAPVFLAKWCKLCRAVQAMVAPMQRLSCRPTYLIACWQTVSSRLTSTPQWVRPSLCYSGTV